MVKQHIRDWNTNLLNRRRLEKAGFRQITISWDHDLRIDETEFHQIVIWRNTSNLQQSPERPRQDLKEACPPKLKLHKSSNNKSLKAKAPNRKARLKERATSSITAKTQEGAAKGVRGKEKKTREQCAQESARRAVLCAVRLDAEVKTPSLWPSQDLVAARC